jgi:hypothetical protein
MNQTDIIPLDLHGSAEAYAMARIVDARMEALAALHTREADIEFLTLQRIAIPLMPYILKVERAYGYPVSYK